MSRIDDLIQELCPDGVDSRKIGDFARVVSGATPSKVKPEYWEGGDIPWLSSGEVNKGTIYKADRFITKAGFDSCSTKMIPARSVVVALAGQGKTRGTAARTRLECCTNQSLAAITCDPSVDSDYLYHFLSLNYHKLREVSSGDGTRGGLNLGMIRAFTLPVPPLEIQQEIVRILDSFTKLEAELEAELEARRAQFDHYRDLLVDETQSGEKRSLGDLEQEGAVKLGRGKVISRRDIESLPGVYPVYSSSGIGIGQFGRYGAYMFDDERITWSVDGGGKFFYRPPHRYSVTNVSGWMKVSRSHFIPRYLFYVLDTLWSREVFNYTRKAHPSVIRDVYRIAEPSLRMQESVVAQLDKFDALVNDLSIGLPAELAARRKQYEYYRDKLLTFKEKQA